MKFSFNFLCKICTNNLSISRAISGEACQEVVTHATVFLSSAFPYNREIVRLRKKEILHVIHSGATNTCQNSSQMK